MTEKQKKFRDSVLISSGIIGFPIFLVIFALGSSYASEWALGHDGWPAFTWTTILGGLFGLIAGLVIWIILDWSSMDYSADELGRECGCLGTKRRRIK